MVSTLNVMAAIEFMGVSFGCNRRKTRKKTTSKEKAAEEVGEKKRSLVTHVGWQATKNSEVAKTHVFS